MTVTIYRDVLIGVFVYTVSEYSSYIPIITKNWSLSLFSAAALL